MRGPLLLALALAVAVCLCLLASGPPLPTRPALAQAGPSFGSETIDDITLVSGDPGTHSVTLPEATGGVAPLSYTLTDPLPSSGCPFDASTRVLECTPGVLVAASSVSPGDYDYTYTVTDSSSPPATASLTFTVTVKDGVALDKAALVALYNATDGDNWTANTNWKSGEALANWHGVSTDSFSGRVTLLFLQSNNLAGSVPAEMGNLSRVLQLIMYDNKLTGGITWLGKMRSLEAVQLYENELTGPIPKELGDASNLQTLWLYENELTGPIPKELGDLNGLKQLWLHNNELTGEIPKELGKALNLEFLTLSNNNLTGPIPRELGNLTLLKQLWLHSNELTGNLPHELRHLTELEIFSVSDNQVSGVIPREWGSLSSLEYLWLHRTQLHTPYYPEVAKLQDLDSLLQFGHNDTMGPAFSSGWGDQLTVEVTFDEALDEDSTAIPAASSFTVTGDGFDVPVTAILVSGQTVTLTIERSLNIPEVEVAVSYDKLAAGQNRLRDLFGNEAESFANEEVDNVTQPSTAYGIGFSELLSKPSIDTNNDGTADTYGVGDNILWHLYWGSYADPVDVYWDVSAANADIEMRLVVGTETRTASLVRESDETSGKGRSLLFRYTVVAEDRDADGFTLHATSVEDVVFLRNGATLQDAQGRSVEREIPGAGDWGNIPGHNVDGSQVETDNTAPELLIAEADGDTLTLTFNEDMAEPDDPEQLTYKFIVQGATHNNAPLFHQSPSRVEVEGSMVTLTLSSAVAPGWPVTLSYSNDREIKPGEDSGLKDGAGNKVASFDELSIDNVTAPGTVPVPISATLVGDRLVLAFDRGLNAYSSPEGSRFVLTNYDSGQEFRAQGIRTPSIRGKTVVVDLDQEIPAGRSAQVIYFAANDDYPLWGQDIHDRLGSVGNQVRDVVAWRAKATVSAAPTVVFSSVSGKDVTLYFDRMLEPASAPAEAAFSAAITTSGVETAVTVSAAHVRETAVYLTLATAAGATDTVTVDYDQPTTEGATLLRDVAGNSVATFSRTLTNEGTTKPATPPALVSASANGDLLKLTFNRPLDPTKAPASGAFVLSQHVFRGILNATVRGKEVWLRLGRTITPCDEAFTLSYLKPGKEALRDRWGQPVDGFSGQEVTNERAGECSTTG